MNNKRTHELLEKCKKITCIDKKEFDEDGSVMGAQWIPNIYEILQHLLEENIKSHEDH